MKPILFLLSLSLFMVGKALGDTVQQGTSRVGNREQEIATTSGPTFLDEEAAPDSTVSPADVLAQHGGILDDTVPPVSSTTEVAVGGGDYIIHYPTIPEPDENTPTGPPPELSPSELAPPARATEQSIILGTVPCVCGRPVLRIVGGENATINSLPWTVALMRKMSDGTIRGPYCGGTLINDRFILTASHCVDGFIAADIQIWLFEENFLVEDENPQPTIRLDITEIIMHPLYNRRTFDNDVALLRLITPVSIATAVNSLTPACLPATNENLYEDEDATVAGWGATEMGGPVSQFLMRVTVPVLSNPTCNARSLYYGRVTENMLCAGELVTGGRDSCQGDSGVPLIVPRNNRYLLIGVVSWGFGCAQPLSPGVYARVGRYPDWILANTPDALYCAL